MRSIGLLEGVQERPEGKGKDPVTQTFEGESPGRENCRENLGGGEAAGRCDWVGQYTRRSGEAHLWDDL